MACSCTSVEPGIQRFDELEGFGKPPHQLAVERATKPARPGVSQAERLDAIGCDPYRRLGAPPGTGERRPWKTPSPTALSINSNLLHLTQTGRAARRPPSSTPVRELRRTLRAPRSYNEGSPPAGGEWHEPSR
jgi:hypothetical protein